MSDLKVLIEHFILEENIYDHDYSKMLDYIQKHRELSEIILLISIFNKSTSDLIKAQALIYLAKINYDKLGEILYLYEEHESQVIHTAAYIARCIFEKSNKYAEKIIYYINKPDLIVAELVHLFDLVLDVCQGIHDAIYNEMRRFPSCDHFMENEFSVHFYLVICEKMRINDKDVISRIGIGKKRSYKEDYILTYLFKNRNKNILRYIYNLASDMVNNLKEKCEENYEIDADFRKKIIEAIYILCKGKLDDLYFIVDKFILDKQVYKKIEKAEIEIETLYSIKEMLYNFDEVDKPFPSGCFGILLEKFFSFRRIDPWMKESLVCYKNAIAVDKIVGYIEAMDLMQDIYKKAVEKGNGILIIKLEEKIRKIDPEGEYISKVYEKNVRDDERDILIDRYNTQLKLD
ncbi:MAG: hypothetical protein NZM04_05505, partial [Methylacidiphilales bacterium]|nr:hypothetical protein [Candidatus Methylacidiphilales bacterium]